VRIRIVKYVEGILEGVSLSHLVPGRVYDVEASLGNYLVQNGSAHELRATDDALVTPLDNPKAFEQLTRGVVVSITDAGTADDRERRGGIDRRKATRNDRRRPT